MTSIDDTRLSLFTVESVAEKSATLLTSDNLSVTITESVEDFGIEQFIGQHQSTTPVLDFASLPGNLGTINATIEVSREAQYNSNLGFYKVLDLDGSVLDPITGEIINTSDSGYINAALDSSNIMDFGGNTIFSALDNGYTSTSVSFSGDSILAPYASVTANDGMKEHILLLLLQMIKLWIKYEPL